MARVTVEDCLEKIPNRFALTVLASRRARALSEGKGTALVPANNKVGVVALREVAKGMVRFEEDVEEVVLAFIEEQRAQLMAGSAVDATFIDAATFTAADDEEEEEDDDVKELPSDPERLADEAEDEVVVEEEEEEEVEETIEEEAIDEDVDPAVLEDLDGDEDIAATDEVEEPVVEDEED
ncbi:DNA-directed RNA polymerase subunit omega [Nannocystaceae bacterium ST9]